MAAISWWRTTLDNVERLWPQGMCRGTLIWCMASPVMLFGPCISLCLWINIRYMSHFQNDSKNTLDLLDLRDKLPSKKADTDGRASWARRAPPRFGDERWFYFIYFISNIMEHVSYVIEIYSYLSILLWYNWSEVWLYFRFVVGAERDRIVDEVGIQEMATFLDTEYTMLPTVPHEVMAMLYPLRGALLQSRGGYIPYSSCQRFR